jgi:hypothetical protein
VNIQRNNDITVKLKIYEVRKVWSMEQNVARDEIVKFYRWNLKRYATSDFIISQLRALVVPLIGSRSGSLH